MTKPPHCPRCNSSMEEGFLGDRGHGNSVRPAQWIDGQPERSFWIGTKTRGKDKYQVSTFRCARCGYLESYATEVPG